MASKIAVDLALLTLVAFSLRLVATTRPSSDNWGVLTKIANQRRSRWITYDLGDSLLPGDFPYPMLFHFVISRLPRRSWAFAAVLLNVSSDLIVGFALYALVWLWLPAARDLPAETVRSIGLLTATVFLTTPILIPVTARVRANNGRAPGLPLVTGALACLALACTGQGLAWLVPAAMFLIGVALTSFFGLQAVVFFAPVLAALLLTPLPVFLLIATGTLCWIFPRLQVKDLLIFKVNHWIWYLRNRSVVSNVANRNLVRNTLRVPVLLWRDPTRGRHVLFRQSPAWIAAYSLPVLWYVGAGIVDPMFREEVTGDPYLWFAVACVCASVVLFILTSIAPLTVFGQAERYFEYTSPALALLAAERVALQEEPGVDPLVVLILIQVSVVLLIHVLSEKRNVRRLTKGSENDKWEKDLARHLEKREGELRVATVPIKLPSLLSYYTKPKLEGRLRYYYRFLMNPERRLDAFEYFVNDTEALDLFAGSPGDLASRYGVDLVIADNAFLAKKRESSRFAEELVQCPVAYRNEKYTLYEVGR